MKRTNRRAQATTGDEQKSASEKELFGGRLLYRTTEAHDAWFKLGVVRSLAALPLLLRLAVGLAWEADRKAVVAVVAAELGGSIARVIGLLALNAALTALLAGGEMPERLRAMVPAVTLVVIASAAAALSNAVSTRFSGPLGPRVERLVRQKYLERSCRVEMAAIENHDFHRLLESARFGASSASRMMDQSVLVLTSLLSLIAMTGVLIHLHWLLSVMLVVMVLPSAWAGLTTARHRYESYQRWLQHDRAADLLCDLLTDADAAAEIRVHDVGPFLLGHHASLAKVAEAEQDRLARVSAKLQLTAAALTGLMTVAICAVLAGLLWTSALALAGLGTAVIAIRQGAGTLTGLVSQVNLLYRESLHVADLRRLLRESANHLIPVGGHRLPAPVSEIRLENITFTYPEVGQSGPALQDVSLVIPTGQIVALVGENGSGKSTLAKLLCGLYLPDSGRIVWDGVDAAGADRAHLFRRFGLVQQDHVRWPLTARTNVIISRSDMPVSESRLAAAAERAGADFIKDLPHGWQTLLTRTFRRGVQLSGGQWQRLGIARAHYRDADILIVDEPTAALDAKAEERVFEQIRALADSGQTILLITHRMSSVRHADLIHVLHEGRLIESGNPEQLLADPTGHYRALYEIQASRYRVPIT
ncbi:ABC transporter ATP-binding protein [Nonomuraea diastatica]|uniref:ABC transporter ATP-binding protein n=1 Tax=Nonomuraea diastatica TaxID=1848329 RepID=A0A4R4WJH7_9ACTN|nr:ABC transporter ATP-binding protein [Nonomuraea diastatica]TDD16614.1 ABC transporter ATP-binding protein [Nonomuraea diastatica]